MMSNFYKILDLPDGSSVEEIKRAYRKKAQELHPDINCSGNAMDKFIQATEAYEFLITHFKKANESEEYFGIVMEEWNLHHRDIARKRAKAYARSSYIQFKNTTFYKTTRIFDGTTVIFSLIIALGVITFSIYGYIWRLHNISYNDEKPSLISFLLLLSVGCVFLIISLVFLRAYYQSSNEYKAKHKIK